MSLEFWITIIAIVVGPFISVLIAQCLQSMYLARQQKMYVFRTLMTTRRTPLSPDRVQALNLVEVEFFKNKKVSTKFRELIALYNDQVRWRHEDERVKSQIIRDVDEKSAELLKEMGATLGFSKDSLELLKGGLLPGSICFTRESAR